MLPLIAFSVVYLVLKYYPKSEGSEINIFILDYDTRA